MGKRLRNDPTHDRCSQFALLASLENGRITRFDCQASNIDNDLRPSLKDAKQHADGAGDAVQVQRAPASIRVSQALGIGADVEWRRESGYFADALEHGSPLAWLGEEVETGDEGGG